MCLALLPERIHSHVKFLSTQNLPCNQKKNGMAFLYRYCFGFTVLILFSTFNQTEGHRGGWRRTWSAGSCRGQPHRAHGRCQTPCSLQMAFDGEACCTMPQALAVSIPSSFKFIGAGLVKFWLRCRVRERPWPGPTRRHTIQKR